MGLFKKLSLRAQVTLLSSAITVTAVLLFTLMSMYSADKIFVSKARDISIASSDDKVENVTIAKEIETATKQEFYSSETVSAECNSNGNGSYRFYRYCELSISYCKLWLYGYFNYYRCFYDLYNYRKNIVRSWAA